MNKKLTRTLAGVMSLMFMGQAVPKVFYMLIQLHLLQKRLKEQRTKTSLPRNLKKQQKILEK